MKGWLKTDEVALVKRLLLEGKTVREIAQYVGRSESSVKRQRYRIMDPYEKPKPDKPKVRTGPAYSRRFKPEPPKVKKPLKDESRFYHSNFEPA